jgi:tRNA threonylcarbamoyl adenosine modification protein YeaZ
MWTLALDRSCAPGSAALFRDGRCVWESDLSGPGAAGHPAGWVRVLGAALEEQGLLAADLGQLAVGLGPGSFSGIRSGLAAVQGLSLPHEIPLLGVSSAAALAFAWLSRPDAAAAVSVTGDARRGRLWRARFRLVGARLRLADGDGERVPSHTAGDFDLLAADELLVGLRPGEPLLTPEPGRIGPPAGGVVTTGRDVGRLVLAEPSAARREPLPIYLFSAVATDRGGRPTPSGKETTDAHRR